MVCVICLCALNTQALKAALSAARQTISQLRAAASSNEADAQATVSSLLSELAEKNSQLVDAERRFSEIEAMLQRIASRAGHGQASGGMEGLRSSFGRLGLFENQQQPLGSSWGGYSPTRSSQKFPAC